MREETGYDVELDGLLGVDVDYVPEAERSPAPGDLRLLRVIYRGHVVGGELTHESDGTTDETRWVPLADVPDLGPSLRPRPGHARARLNTDSSADCGFLR